MRRARNGVVVFVMVAAISAATADEAPDWRGPWRVEGSCSWRHVGPEGRGLVLEGRVGGFDLSVRGAAARDGFVLRGSAIAHDDGAERPAHLMARSTGEGLTVTLEVQGRATWRETWLRAEAPALRLDVPGDRLGRTRNLSVRTTRDGLRVELRVAGRPLVVVLTVLAPDDPRYVHLGGVVHHEVLNEGAALAVGRHEVAWSGLDRSLDPAPLRPGRYVMRVHAADDLLGAPPGEDTAAPEAEVALVVGSPPVVAASGTLTSAPEASRPALAGGERPRAGLADLPPGKSGKGSPTTHPTAGVARR